MQHVVLRGPTDFEPFSGKMTYHCQAVTFVPFFSLILFYFIFLEQLSEQMTDANNNNLSNKLRYARSLDSVFLLN